MNIREDDEPEEIYFYMTIYLPFFSLFSLWCTNYFLIFDMWTFAFILNLQNLLVSFLCELL